MINHGRNAIGGRNGQELRLELLTPADIYRNDFVGSPGLLEKDRDLVAVGRRPVVEVYHRVVSYLPCSIARCCNMIRDGSRSMQRRCKSSRRNGSLPVQHPPELQDELEATRSSDLVRAAFSGRE